MGRGGRWGRKGRSKNVGAKGRGRGTERVPPGRCLCSVHGAMQMCHSCLDKKNSCKVLIISGSLYSLIDLGVKEDSKS